MLGVVNVPPVPRDVPPVATEYQLMVPPFEVADKFRVPASQREPGVVDVMLGVIFTVAKIGLLEERQLLLSAST